MDNLCKLDAATRLVVEAVRLYYDRRDIIAVHALVASAHQVLFDLGKGRGIAGTLKNTAGMRQNEVQDYLRRVNYPFNFLKHADRDPDARIDVGPLEKFSQDFIMDAVVMLQMIHDDLPFEAKVFWMWFVGKYPEEFGNLPEDSEIRRLQAVGVVDMDFSTISQFLRMWSLGTEGDLTANPSGYGVEGINGKLSD